MKPLDCVVDNFGSYKHLEFSFDALGLALVSGPTGSGKSTLADVVPWTCWGTTSKGGTVEDIRAWGAQAPTKSALRIELPDGTITVTRIRGKTSQNDLYWTEAGSDEPQRGKDAADTQKLLDARLGIDEELFSLSGYFSQFADADRFFVAKPKDRRETAEKIVDLSYPVFLAQRASDTRKAAKRELELWQSHADRDTGKLVQMKAQLESNTEAVATWEAKHARELTTARAKVAEWDASLVSQIRQAQAKADAWTLEHESARAELQAKCDAFEGEKAAKIAKLLTNMETTASALGDLANPAEKRIAVQARQSKLEEGKQSQQERRIEMATLEAKRKQLDATYRKFAKNTGTCPECLGPAQNANCASFLEKTKAEIDAAQDRIRTLTGLIGESEASLRVESDSIAKELEQIATLQRMVDLLDRQLELDAAAAEAAESAVNIYFGQLDQHSNSRNPYADAPAQLKTQQNPHSPVLQRIETATNPYSGQSVQISVQIEAQQKTVDQDAQQLEYLNHRIASLTTLYDLSFVLRGEMLRNSVKLLQRETNKRLEKYFDGEFRVEFTLDDDKLGVDISKNGHECRFPQLSGGQRRELTLCFWVALRRLAMNKAGVELSLLTGDEMLTGLDDELKVKAYRLFEDLANETESVILIDHSEPLKGLFAKKFEVSIDGDESSIHAVES